MRRFSGIPLVAFGRAGPGLGVGAAQRFGGTAAGKPPGGNVDASKPEGSVLRGDSTRTDASRKAPADDDEALEEASSSPNAPPPPPPEVSLSRLRSFFDKLTAVEMQNDDIINSAKHVKRKRAKILAARQRMLVFRDVAKDLDRIVVKRDSVEFLKFLTLGSDYAIDVELERMLRFFPEHSVMELKVSYMMKLYSGLRQLCSPAGSVLLPALSVVKAAQFFEPPAAGVPYDPSKFLKHTSLKYASAAVTSMSPMFFKQPTLLFFGPIGTTSSHEIEALWRGLYVDFIVGEPPAAAPVAKVAPAAAAPAPGGGRPSGAQPSPSVRKLKPPPGMEAPAAAALPAVPAAPPTAAAEPQPPQQYTAGTSELKFFASMSAPVPRMLPDDLSRKPAVDFITLRDLESGHRWFHSRIVKRSLHRFPYPLMQQTYVGVNVLGPFFETALPLRNPRATYLLLVDHHGRVRWTSSGPPDAMERALLPSLLQQLVVEQLKEGTFGLK